MTIEDPKQNCIIIASTVYIQCTGHTQYSVTSLFLIYYTWNNFFIPLHQNLPLSFKRLHSTPLCDYIIIHLISSLLMYV